MTTEGFGWDDDPADEAANSRRALASRTPVLSPVAPRRPPRPPSPSPLLYRSVDEFVRRFLIHQYSRVVGPASPRRWQARWWANGEAIMRLEALWRAFEALRTDPGTGTAVWIRDYLDPTMAALMSPDGPFRDSNDMSRRGEPLPYEAPPPELFPEALSDEGLRGLGRFRD